MHITQDIQANVTSIAIAQTVGFIVQELGRYHNRTYKAHPFDFSTDLFLSTLQKDSDTDKTSPKNKSMILEHASLSRGTESWVHYDFGVP